MQPQRPSRALSPQLPGVLISLSQPLSVAGQIDVRQPTLEIAFSGRTAAMQKDAAPGTDGQQLPQESGRERERVQNVSSKRSSGFVSFSATTEQAKEASCMHITYSKSKLIKIKQIVKELNKSITIL